MEGIKEWIWPMEGKLDMANMDQKVCKEEQESLKYQLNLIMKLKHG